MVVVLVVEAGMDMNGELEGKEEVLVVVQDMMKYSNKCFLFDVSDLGPAH